MRKQMPELRDAQVTGLRRAASGSGWRRRRRARSIRTRSRSPTTARSTRSRCRAVRSGSTAACCSGDQRVAGRRRAGARDRAHRAAARRGSTDQDDGGEDGASACSARCSATPAAPARRRSPARMLANGVFLKFSRDDEREADRVGLQIMTTSRLGSPRHDRAVRDPAP